MKRIISVLLTITMLLGVTASVPLNVSAVTTDRVESRAVIETSTESTTNLEMPIEPTELIPEPITEPIPGYIGGDMYINEYGEWRYGITDDGEGCIIVDYYDRNVTELKIPDNINGLPVLQIASFAFADYVNLTSIIIPDSITDIGSCAFFCCDNLTTVYYAGSEREWDYISIGDYDNNDLTDATFYYNYSYGEIVWGDTYSGVFKDEYGDWFYEHIVNSKGRGYRIVGCYLNMTDIKIPGYINDLPVLEIDSCIFRNGGLTSIIIPDTVTAILSSEFYDCDSLTAVYYTGSKDEWNSIVISDGGNACLKNAIVYYEIGEIIEGDVNSGIYKDRYGEFTYQLTDNGKGYEIIGYSGTINDIKIPTSINNLPVLVIGTLMSRSLTDVTNITSIKIPSSVTAIGEMAFGFVDNLTHITIPYGVTSIGDSAFFDCHNLTGIIFPDSVTTIGEHAFWYCNEITSITIPYSVTSIGDGAFSNCYGLTSVDVSPYNKNYSSLDGILFNKSQSTLICYPNDKLSFEYTIPNSVTAIGNRAFSNCENLINITIPSSVTTIGDRAFSYCESLTSIIIPDGVTAIGDSAFSNCESLTSIIIPDGVTIIGDRLFYYCKNLTSITIPDGITIIGDYMFGGCDALTSITLPDGVTHIAHSAFRYCDNLTNITIPNSVITIDYCAFECCDSLTDVYYTGSESQWNSISIRGYNEKLENATIHYNYVPLVAGDINGDGKLGVNDVLYLLKNIVGDTELTAEQTALADVSGDGRLTVLDAILIQRLILETA